MKKFGNHNFYNIEEFCRNMKVSRQTFHRWKLKGISPKTIKIGGRVYIEENEFCRWIDKNIKG